VKDFERKVREARRTPGEKPRGWLLDECGLRGNETAMLDYGAKLRDGLLASVEKESKSKLEIPSILVPSEVGKLSKSGGGVWDNWLLNPTGYVGDLARWMVISSGTPQPKLSVLAAMIAAGAVFGGKVRDISDGRTNLYGMGVAESSAGKDHPFKCILKLFAAAGAEKLLGGGRVTSDSALEVALMENYAQLFGFDESGDFLSHIKQAGSGSGNSSHLSTIKPALKELWSSANCLYRGKQRAEGELRRILEPHVCLWCLSTPGRLYQGITADDLADGFLARIIFAISFDWPDYSFTTAAPPPDSLVSITQAWLMRQISAPEGMKDVAAATTRHQLLVPMQPDAVTIFNRFNKQCAKLLREGTQKGDKIAPLWGKAFENARRIALTLASGDRYDGAEIMEYHAKYSCTFIEQTILDTIDSISQNMAENRFEADKQRLVKLIARAGRDGMSKGIFSTKTGFLDKRQRDSYIAELVECNEIVFGRNPDHPEARSGWLWKYPHGLDVIERSLPGTGSPRPAGVGAGPKGPKSTPGGSK
jgi:hypothetical protein